MNNISFARNLVKGRIAETIFAQMLRDTQNFTVLEFGYEKVIPDLVGLGSGHDNPVLETLRVAPDFAVINRTTKEVRLIEVKYRRDLDQANVLECARKMHASWNPSYLFIATLESFYFDEVSEIIANMGHIAALQNSLVPHSLQADYLKILSDFEKSN